MSLIQEYIVYHNSCHTSFIILDVVRLDKGVITHGEHMFPRAGPTLFDLGQRLSYPGR